MASSTSQNFVQHAHRQTCFASRPIQRKLCVAKAAPSGSYIDPSSYMAVGLAHCFEKGSEGKLVDRMQIEPLSASSLESLAAGITLAEALARNRDVLPGELQVGRFCDNWTARCHAAARTWSRPHAQDNLMDLVPLGRVRGNFNFSLDDKRVLNVTVEVSDDDNIKQDISIDVYGRKEKAEQEAAAFAAVEQTTACSAAQAKEEEEDELDQLLLA